MPELPEVETVVRDLRPHLTGRRIVRVRTGEKRLRGHWSAEWPEYLTGRTFTAIRRRGKWILLDLDRGILVVHLGMTGRLTAGAADRPMEDHTHLVIDLDDGRQLRFRDVRRFGSVTVYESASEFEAALAGRLGPEPSDLGRAEFREALSSTARALESRAARSADRRRGRQYLRRRGAVRREAAAGPARPSDHGRRSRPVAQGNRSSARQGDKPPRLHNSRLCRRVGKKGIISE